MRKTTRITMLLLVGVATTLLLAQSPPQPPDPATMVQHRVQFLTNMLNLTQAQQVQASTIFTSAEQSNVATMQNLHAAHQALRTAIRNNDATAIDQASTAIGTLTAQMTSTRAKAEAAFMQILNADQQSKFSTLHKGGRWMHRGSGFEPGPGAPPAPGPEGI